MGWISATALPASLYCVIGADARVQGTGSVRTIREALEVGAYSPWVSRLLAALRYEVLVTNARRVRLITAAARKSAVVRQRLI